MEYIPETHQFTCIVNKKVSPITLMNAVGHMTAGLVSQHAENLEPMRFRDFVDKDKSIHPSTSENGFIILRSKNSNQLRTLRNKLIEDGVRFTDFTETMVEGTYVEQQEDFDKTNETDLEYLGLCFFIEKDKSREYTKKFHYTLDNTHTSIKM